MIFFEKVTKEFPNGTIALLEVSFYVDPGEFVFLVGPSGAGKTTILRLLLRELEPTSGNIHIGNQDLASIKKKHLPEFRRQIGAAFQDFKLIDDRTVQENVALISEMVKSTQQDIDEHVRQILERVGLAVKSDLFPSQLSGGELQRTTIARALATQPKILFADEPTGNLDQATSWEIMSLLLDINKSGTTVLIATHNQEIINQLDKRVIELNEGRVVRDTKKQKPIDEDKKEEDQEDKEENGEEEKKDKADGTREDKAKKQKDQKKKVEKKEHDQ